MNGHPDIRDAHTRGFVDPDEYQSAIHAGDDLYSLLRHGDFRAELTSVEIGRLTLQRGREVLPRLASSGMPPNRVGILGWPGDGRLPIVRGAQMRPGELMCLGLGMQSHHRTSGPNEFVSLTLDQTELDRAAIDLTGNRLAITSGEVLRPPGHLREWFFSVIYSAIRAVQATPMILASPQATAALEQALVRPMILCMVQGEVQMESIPRGRRAVIAKRFEATVDGNFDTPLLVPDLCRMIGVPGRTLRALCQEQLGMSPQRFLALRRLHLTRRALLRSDHRSMTVTDIVTGHGVWELGRFAVAYKSLFGESPSATLRRTPERRDAEIPVLFGSKPNPHSSAVSLRI
jgi:AraC-like DNA-binding protein